MSRRNRRSPQKPCAVLEHSTQSKTASAVGRPASARCRQTETKPLIEAFKLWLDARLMEVSKKSGLARAIRYTLSHWEGLTRFIEDGRIEIDNKNHPVDWAWPEESFRRQSRWRRHMVDLGFTPQYGAVE